jgi:hypothetical protein
MICFLLFRMAGQKYMVVKVCLDEHDIRRFRGSDLADIMKQLENLIPDNRKKPNAKLVLKYKDEVGDQISVETDTDVDIALACQQARNDKVLTPKFSWVYRHRNDQGETKEIRKPHVVNDYERSRARVHVIKGQYWIWVPSIRRWFVSDAASGAVDQTFWVNLMTDEKWKSILRGTARMVPDQPQFG